MSKLTEHQIRALVPGMEATAKRYRAEGKISSARRTEARLEEYRADLVAYAKTAQVEQSQTDLSSSNSTNRFSKTAQVEQSREVMTTKKDALQIAGDQVEAASGEALELGMWVGRQQAFGMIAAKASAAQAQCLKRIKDGAEYKSLGLTWEQFCDQHVGISRASADRIIGNFEEFGAAYFALSAVTRISPTTYRLIASAVDESTVEIDGEKIPITKANAARISEAVTSLSKTVAAKDERIAEQKRDADKLRNERNAASKAAEKARQEFLDYKRKQAERFPNADEDHTTLLDAQSLFDLAMAKLSTIYNRDLNEANQGRYIGLTEYMYRHLIQASFNARDKYGVSWNMAEPSDLMATEQVAPNPRNLVAEMATSKGSVKEAK